MDHHRTHSFIENLWFQEVMPALCEYISIPCVSPAFSPDWQATGFMVQATELLATWARQQLAGIKGSQVEIHHLPGRTPLLLVDIPASTLDPRPVILYGHLDKQPEMSGWLAGRSAWKPKLEGDRLYGRGGADDGYALFSAVLAVLALEEQQLPRPRCILLIEASEESSSEDLPYYFDYLADRLDAPSLVVALDSMCGNYHQLWTTTSLRGQVSGTLSVRVLDEAIHSGEASGIVPSSFRIATQLLGRIEDPLTGRVTHSDFCVEIPKQRQLEASRAANVLQLSAYSHMPFTQGTKPVSDDITTLLLERSWCPQLAVLGADGLPSVQEAASVMLPMTALKISLRLPPTLNAAVAGENLKRLLESDPPYGCNVSFDIAFTSSGWHAPETADWLTRTLNSASVNAFGQSSVSYGGGGGIPFLNMLGERFPDSQFVVTGVLGPQSNAHGPNEFLHIPAAINLTSALAEIIHASAIQQTADTECLANCTIQTDYLNEVTQ